jgi:hypothetical protein
VRDFAWENDQLPYDYAAPEQRFVLCGITDPASAGLSVPLRYASTSHDRNLEPRCDSRP